MRQQFLAVALSSMVLWLIGCSDGSTSRPNPTTDTSVDEPSPPPPPPLLPHPSSTSGVPGSASTGQAIAQPQPPPSAMPVVSEPQTLSAGQQSIRLSAGVALPQTGPEGTLMSFSVDYEFTQGKPSSSGYVWVIERTHGVPARQSVQLAKQGNLPILIQGWRPEDGPFQTYMEDRSGNRLSALIELR